MSYKRVLTIQDISCVGQCSLTVALPIISACGVETGIIPSAILSTHTAGFSGFTFRDLTSDIPECAEVLGEYGVVFRKSDVSDLTSVLSDLCNNPAVVEGYKSKAQDYICNKYSWDDVVTRTLELYKG